MAARSAALFSSLRGSPPSRGADGRTAPASAHLPRPEQLKGRRRALHAGGTAHRVTDQPARPKVTERTFCQGRRAAPTQGGGRPGQGRIRSSLSDRARMRRDRPPYSASCHRSASRAGRGACPPGLPGGERPTGASQAGPLRRLGRAALRATRHAPPRARLRTAPAQQPVPIRGRRPGGGGGASRVSFAQRSRATWQGVALQRSSRRSTRALTADTLISTTRGMPVSNLTIPACSSNSRRFRS